MSRCYFLEDKLLRSSTKKLFVGGINIRNISTKPWSNLNEESVQQFSNFCLIARFQSLILYFIYYCFIRFAGSQFIDGLPGLTLITSIIVVITTSEVIMERSDKNIYSQVDKIHFHSLSQNIQKVGSDERRQYSQAYSPKDATLIVMNKQHARIAHDGHYISLQTL